MGPLGAVDGIDPKPFAIAVVGGLLLSGVAVGATVSNMRNVSAVAASKMETVTGTSTPSGGEGDGGGNVSANGGNGAQGSGGSSDAGNVSEMQGATGDPSKVSDQQQQQQVSQVPVNQQPVTQQPTQQSAQQAPQGSASTETVPIKDAVDKSSGNGDVVLHVVSSGESIEGLAVKYGSSVDAIISANGLEGASGVPVGTRLVIPVTNPGSADAWGLG